MKRFISLILISMLLISSVSFGEGNGIDPNEKVYTDEDFIPSDWTLPYLERLREEHRYRESMGPARIPITKVKFFNICADLFYKKSGISFTNALVEDPFEDYTGFKARVFHKLGIISGDGSGKANMFKNITKEEMAVMLVKTMQKAGADLKSPTGDLYEDDASISNWAKPYVYIAKANNLLGDGSDKYFKPSATRTIEEVYVEYCKILDGFDKIYAYGEPKRTVDILVYLGEIKEEDLPKKYTGTYVRKAIFESKMVKDIWMGAEDRLKVLEDKYEDITLIVGNQNRLFNFITENEFRIINHPFQTKSGQLVKIHLDDLTNGISFSAITNEDGLSKSIDVLTSLFNSKKFAEEITANMKASIETPDQGLNEHFYWWNDWDVVMPIKWHQSEVLPELEYSVGTALRNEYTGGRIRFIEDRLYYQPTDDEYFHAIFANPEVEEAAAEFLPLYPEQGYGTRSFQIGHTEMNYSLSVGKIGPYEDSDYNGIKFELWDAHIPSASRTIKGMLNYFTQNDYIWNVYYEATGGEDYHHYKGSEEWQVSDKGYEFMIKDDTRGNTIILRFPKSKKEPKNPYSQIPKWFSPW